jgi:poly-gamma-glutamate capsule biosynthesis protein CapA/YwtB (metallophosphatase superfamily)
VPLSSRARRNTVGAFVGVVVVAGVAALAIGFEPGDDDRGVRGLPSSSSSPSSASSTRPPATPVPTTESRRGSGEAVVLAFGGDVHFESFLRPQLDASPTGMLAPIAPVLRLADVAVVNVETAITERGVPVPKDFNFRAPATAFLALARAGVDVGSMANNHGLDYGPVGIDDALAASKQYSFPVVGIGRNAREAYRPWTTTVRGQRIAVIGATQVIDGGLIESWTATDTQGGLASAKDEARLLQEVRAARAAADTVVVFLHWGVSGQACPGPVQQDLARALVDAGADVIVGGHSHVVEGAGWMGRAAVAYGLGNFVWYARPGPSAETGVLLVRVVGRDVEAIDWVPARIVSGIPRPLTGAPAAAAQERWRSLRGCTGLADRPAP